MVGLISRQRGGLAALKLTKLFGIDDFPAAKDSGKVLIIIKLYPCIRLERGKFELTNQDSAGGENSSVLM